MIQPVSRSARRCAYLVYHLSNLREPWGISQQTYLFKIANRWPRTMGSVRKGIKRPKCVAQKPPPAKKGQPDSRVKRSQPMRFGLWRALVSLPSHIIVFSTMIYDRSDRAFVFPSNFFFFFPRSPTRTALDSDAAMRRGTSSATPRNFRSWRLFSRRSKRQYFFYRM